MEENLRKQGIDSWDSFLSKDKVKGISKLRKLYYDRKITEARKALYNFDSTYFKNKLPSSEYYLLYDFFKEDTVFLDIETTGLSPNYNEITMIGLYDGTDTKIMIKDINLDMKEIKKELQKYKLLVTFNGRSFDAPFIEKQYPGTIPNIPHLDLRTISRRLGLTGGLKAIEQEIGIKRRELVHDLTGGDALKLWKMYKSTGDDHYLNLLVEYNEEDIINLKTLADYCMGKIRMETI